jgi:hypothetical protein
MGQEVYEVRRTGYRRVQEFWEPKLEELDTLLVTRQIPTLHILLSMVSMLWTWIWFPGFRLLINPDPNPGPGFCDKNWKEKFLLE